MKTKLLAIFVLFPMFLFSQELKMNEETGKYEYQGIIDSLNETKQELFQKTLEWIALNYKSSDDVIQYKNEDTGKIIIKGNFGTDIFFKQGWLRHTAIFEFKDGRIRYTYTDFSYYSSGSGDMSFEKNMSSKKKIMALMEDNINKSISSLTTFLNSNKKSDDW
jgi:hypothetical protein